MKYIAALTARDQNDPDKAWAWAVLGDEMEVRIYQAPDDISDDLEDADPETMWEKAVPWKAVRVLPGQSPFLYRLIP